MATKASSLPPSSPHPSGALTGSGALQTVQDLTANPTVQQLLSGIAGGVSGAVATKVLNRPSRSDGSAGASGSNQQGPSPQE
ncbi:hypothetical protein QF035_000228 [Streptomyces umbrinus]|uniref:Uncharacterized protein n=1 Tax=Streptomyces umbrinus TaxID=67370 RepID=A0ABU0SIY8_9ACTN|nr:hypothetical protein [Streptomyces umbrinus]MDQ1022646.1 hypothetical protein [Streptomyces umbrinus]